MSLWQTSAQGRFAFAGHERSDAPVAPAALRLSRRSRVRRFNLTARLRALAHAPGVGAIMVFAFLSVVGAYGMAHGGAYAAFVAEYGGVSDVAARAFGFGIDSVTIVGARELTEGEILAAGDISARNSLVFLDAAGVRERLTKLPLIRDASVTKLYPNRLVINLTERSAYALWQSDGQVQVVSADGTPFDIMRDARFADLPFVVGEGANRHVAEFVRIVEAAPDLRGQIRAGVYVGGRRWNVKFAFGVDLKLPQQNPEAAMQTFARLARESRLLDKDVVSYDLRQPGRLVARLSEDAATARAETLIRRRGRGGLQ